MEMFSSSVIADLVNRSVSLLLGKCKKQAMAATVQEDLHLLRRLLMRSDTIIEEAERRHVSNPHMLRQLRALRNKTYRGYYVLDTIRCQSHLGVRGGGRGGEDKEEEAARRPTFALSRFNPVKRIRFPSGELESRAALNDEDGADASSNELHRIACSLETIIGGMDEFVVLLMSCPPLYRQPYSAHLSLD